MLLALGSTLSMPKSVRPTWDHRVGDIVHSALGCCWLSGLCYPCQRPLDQLGATRRPWRGSQCWGDHPPIQHWDAVGFGVNDIRAKGPWTNQGLFLPRTECNELGEAIWQCRAGAASCPRGMLGLDPGMLLLGSSLCCTPSSQISSAFWHRTNPSWKQRVQREGGQTDSSKGTEGRPQPHYGPIVVLIEPSLGRGGRSQPGSLGLRISSISAEQSERLGSPMAVGLLPFLGYSPAARPRERLSSTSMAPAWALGGIFLQE